MPREPAKAGWVVLRDPEDKGPNLSFQGRDQGGLKRRWTKVDAAGTSNSTNVRLTRQKLPLFQWLVIPQWFFYR